MRQTRFMAPLDLNTPVGVIGAGTMGAGIAQVAAVAGHPVRIHDDIPGVAAEAIDRVQRQLARLAGKGRLDAGTAKRAGAALTAVTSISDLADCGLVVEAIVEDLPAKQVLFTRLETVCDPDAILASNTSSLSITDIAAELEHPERVAGLHFFNPAPLLPLVEVVRGEATSQAVADLLSDTAAAWGKQPVQCTSTPGFIVNRVARPYYAEAFRLLAGGLIDPTTLDAVMREAGGFRMGPCELTDLIGRTSTRPLPGVCGKPSTVIRDSSRQHSRTRWWPRAALARNREAASTKAPANPHRPRRGRVQGRRP